MFPNFDNEALMKQLGGGAKGNAPDIGGAIAGMKGGAPAMGADLGPAMGGFAKAPTSNTMPIRERAPINDQVAAAPSPLPAPPMVADQQPLDQQPPDIGSGVGALAGMLKAPTPQNINSAVGPQAIGNALKPETLNRALGPQAIGNAVQGVGNALKPQNVLNALKPRNVGNALRNPLVALHNLFGRRR